MILGDWRWFWPETLQYFSPIPSAWDSSLNTGIGQSGLATLWINQYLNLTASLTHLGIPWWTVSLLFWQLPPLILSAIGAFYAYGKFFPENKKWGYFASLVYTCNTYFFLMYLGGQLGVALAYGLFPFVIGRFISFFHTRHTSRDIALNGLLLGFLVVFDIRIAFLAAILIGVSWLYFSRHYKKFISGIMLPFGIAGGLHTYWILPLVLFRQNPLNQYGVTSTAEATLSFFSFADFSHALSLLHPNWPENIFGKTYFLQPEFLLIPLIAFCSLLLMKEQEKLIRFLALVALGGVFLSKGVQDPFGTLYEWFYKTIPGFTMFRDPTKFYVVTAFSYAMLIPHTLAGLFNIKNRVFNIVGVILFVGLWIWPLRLHAIKIVDSFRPYTIPEEYGRLTRFLADQPQFFRTLWIPQWQRYGYFSDLHPAIGRFEVLTDASASGQLTQLEVPDIRNRLTALSVKYIIIPYDSQGELFLNDRKFDEKQYVDALSSMRKTGWVREIGGFGKIGVFEVTNPRGGRFFYEGTSDGGNLSYIRKSPSRYEVITDNDRPIPIVFSEKYDPLWKVYPGTDENVSDRTQHNLNRFYVPENIPAFSVEYEPQQGVYWGLAVSVLTFIFITYSVKKKRE